MDWTGSMYGYGGEVMLWHLLNFSNNLIYIVLCFSMMAMKNKHMLK